MTNGTDLWSKAKKLIPGGNMLLSKRSEMFLPDQWPSYFSKSKGCQVSLLLPTPTLSNLFSQGKSKNPFPKGQTSDDIQVKLIFHAQ